jgi:hypothetical protein
VLTYYREIVLWKGCKLNAKKQSSNYFSTCKYRQRQHKNVRNMLCSALLAFTGRAFLWGNYTLWNHKNSSHMALPRSSLKKSAEDMEDTWSYRLMGLMEVDSCCIWLATLYQRWRFRLSGFELNPPASGNIVWARCRGSLSHRGSGRRSRPSSSPSMPQIEPFYWLNMLVYPLRLGTFRNPLLLNRHVNHLVIGSRFSQMLGLLRHL